MNVDYIANMLDKEEQINTVAKLSDEKLNKLGNLSYRKRYTELNDIVHMERVRRGIL